MAGMQSTVKLKQTMLAMSEDRQMIEQLSAKARAAIAESRQLAATRDALLPELMSGRLGVLQSSR